jgi:hypothetical protein
VRARGTYILSCAKGGLSQSTKTNRAVYSRPVERQVRTRKERGRDGSTYELSSTKVGTSQERKCPSKDTHSLSSAEGGTIWSLRKSERARGTHVLPAQRERQVRSPKEIERARGTYKLSSTEGQVRTPKKSERVRALTSCRAQMEG